MANRLTVIIPCKNERHNIRACIESVRAIADEILVADSGSTDGTLDEARRAGGCHIIEREFVDYANFKNWAIEHAEHPWILFVDADERVTEQLAAEIAAVLSKTLPADAYRMRFEPYFLGFRIRHSGWNTTSAVRLFRRDVCRYRKQRVHEGVEVSTGRIGKLKGKFRHYTCRSFTQWMEKQNHYATLAAEEMYAAGRRVGYLGLLLRPPLRFFQFYILRCGFLDGAAGLLVCTTVAFYTFMKYAKLWELTTASGIAGQRHDGPRPEKLTTGEDHQTDPTGKVSKAA